jgi:hypothetical protein
MARAVAGDLPPPRYTIELPRCSLILTEDECRGISYGGPTVPAWLREACRAMLDWSLASPRSEKPMLD